MNKNICFISFSLILLFSFPFLHTFRVRATGTSFSQTITNPTAAPTSTTTNTTTSSTTTSTNNTATIAPTGRPAINLTIKRPSIVIPTITPNTTVGTRLFDIILTIENALLNRANYLVANIQFTSFGNVPTLVKLVYRIEDSIGKVVFTENGEVTVETEKTVTKDFKSLDLKSGKYTLILTTIYGNNVQDEFKQAFEVKGVATTKGIPSTVLWVVSAVVIVGGAIYLFIKRRKINT